MSRPAAVPAPTATHWYGWQTLAADMGAVGVMNVGPLTRGGSSQGSIILAGVGLYALGGPAVHVFRRGELLDAPLVHDEDAVAHL